MKEEKNMGKQVKRQLFSHVSNDEVRKVQRETQKKREEAEMKVYTDAVNSAEIKAEDAKCLFTTVSNEEVEKTKMMAEEAGKKAEEDCYLEAMGFLQTGEEMRNASAVEPFPGGTVMAVGADNMMETRAEESGHAEQYIETPVEEKKMPINLFEHLCGEEVNESSSDKEMEAKG